MAGPDGTQGVESALAAYQSLGSSRLIGDLPPEADQWLEACEGQELPPEETLTLAWLGIERGFQEYQDVDRLRTRAGGKGKGRPAPHIAGGGSRMGRGHRLMQQAEARLSELMDVETAPEYVQAQAALTFGALPFLEALRAPVHRHNVRLQQTRSFRFGQAYAIEAAHQAIQRGELSARELAFLRLLGVIVIGNNLRGNEIAVLPAPPRSYEGQAPNRAWHSVLWDIRRNQELYISLAASTSLSGRYAILPDALSEDEINADAVQIIEQLRAVMLDRDHGVPPDSTLGEAVVAWASLLGGLSKRKQAAVLDLIPFADSPGEPIQVPVDLDPVEAPEINLAQLTTGADLLAWYREQVNGRVLAPQEGLLINKALETYTPSRIARLSPEEQLTLGRIRLECTQAVAGRFTPVAVRQLELAEHSLQQTQWAAKDAGDMVTMYEAAVDVLRLRVIGDAIRGESTGLTRDGLMGGLSELLVEIDFEKQRTRDKTVQASLAALTRGVVYSVLSTSEDGLLALPTFGRERGSEQYPGWDINVWRVGSDGVISADSRRRLRMSDTVDRVMRQGNVGVVPSRAITKTVQIPIVVQNLISLAEEGDKSRRAAKLIERWRTSLQPIFDEALGLVT